MGGLRKYMPITFVTMITGWLAICGIPFFAGFFSKDEILWKTWSAAAFGMPNGFSKILWAIGALTALLTAVYMTRMMVMTFWGDERFRDTHAHAEEDSHIQATDEEHAHHGPIEPHESPWIMTVPLIVLAVLSTVGGFIGVPYAMSSIFSDRDINVIEHTLEPVVAQVPAASHSSSAQPELLSPPPQETDSASPIHALPETAETGAAAHAVHDPAEITQERILAGVSVLIALAGIAIGWTIFRKRPLLQLPSILEKKYYVDEIYDAAIIRPIEVGSREGLWKIFDIGVIDGFLHSIGDAVVEAGRLGRYLQAGFVRAYAAIILTGALIIIGLFVYYSIPRL